MSRKNTLLMPDEPARDPEPHPIDRPQQVPAVKTLGRLFGVMNEQSQRAAGAGRGDPEATRHR